MPILVVTHAMVVRNEPSVSLEAAARTVDEETIEAFKCLASETRLTILLALWESKEPGPPLGEFAEPVLSFTELRERIGMRDKGQFNYHLDKLVGTFVEATEGGYKLTHAAERILCAVFAGTLDDASLHGEPIDTVCLNCRSAMVMDYADGILIERCTECEGVWRIPGDPPGLVAKLYRPPVGLSNLSPQAFYRHGNVWDRYRTHSMMEGVCPDCSGTITTTVHVCEDHDVDEGPICESCGTFFEIQAFHVCDVCKQSYTSPVYMPIFTEMAVKVFFFEHGLDAEALVDEYAWEVQHDAITRVDVRREDPLEIGVRVELDGDRLDVTLDGDARVIDLVEA